MAQYESNVKHVPYSQERVYDKLSDLNNLAAIRERMDEMREKIGDKIQDMTFDRDSLTLTVQGMNVTLRIIEREPCKCIKFEGDKSPIPLNLWIQILPVNENEAKMKVTIRAEVNMFKYLGLEGGPPDFPQGSSCPAVLWIQTVSLHFRLRGSHTVSPAFPCRSSNYL